MAIAAFIVAHWFLSLFFQTVFQHRYAAHGMFTMSRAWERVFYIAAFIAQGTSFLNPRAYAIMHRRHHDHSDTELDPHSPRQSGNVVKMMWHTIWEFGRIRKDRPPLDSKLPEPPEWPAFDRYVANVGVRLAYAGVYVAFYMKFATATWQFALIPVHLLMGPIHGAIVNWCGHRYGYRNYTNLGDDSRNTFPMDLLLLGELFQNNHHRSPSRPDFAHRRFEVDPVYPALRLLNALGIIQFAQRLSPAPLAGRSRETAGV